MKLYFLSSYFYELPDERDEYQPYLDAVVEIVAGALQPTGGEGIIGVWQAGEVGMEAEPFDAQYVDKRIKNLGDGVGLRKAIYRVAADPYGDEPYFMMFRCLTTCRSAYFGFDGKVWLLLGEDDAPPSASPLVQVQECTKDLCGWDIFD